MQQEEPVRQDCQDLREDQVPVDPWDVRGPRGLLVQRVLVAQVRRVRADQWALMECPAQRERRGVVEQAGGRVLPGQQGELDPKGQQVLEAPVRQAVLEA